MKLKQKLIEIQTNANFLPKKKEGYKFDYNPESQVLEFVKGQFKKYQIGYYFNFGKTDLDNISQTIFIHVECTLFDDTEELVLHDVFGSFIVPLTPKKAKMEISQYIGSAKTYGIRYFFTKLLGIADDNIDPDALLNEEYKKREKNPPVAKTSIISDVIKKYTTDLKSVLEPDLFLQIFQWVKINKPQTIKEIDNQLELLREPKNA